MCPAQPPRKLLTGASRATGLDEARRTKARPQGTPERNRANPNQGTRTGARQQRPPGTAKAGGPCGPGSGVPMERSARKATHTVGSAGPHAWTAHPKPVGSRPLPHARGTCGPARKSDQPLTALIDARGNPAPSAFLPPPQRATPARKSVRCGVNYGLLRLQPPCGSKEGSGYRQKAPMQGSRGEDSVQPQTPLTEARGAPPPRRLAATPTVRNARSQERALWGR